MVQEIKKENGRQFAKVQIQIHLINLYEVQRLVFQNKYYPGQFRYLKTFPFSKRF